MQVRKINSFSNNNPILIEQKNKFFLRQCNICNEKFQANFYERFCPSCRHENEELKFSDWLPDLDIDEYYK